MIAKPFTINHNVSGHKLSNITILTNNFINNPRDWDFWDYSLLACLIFGTIGNSLSIMVMSAKRLRNTNAALFVNRLFFKNLKKLSLNLK